MEQITIFSATNRPNSNTEKIANYYHLALKAKGVKAEVFSLKDLPPSILISDMYGQRSAEFQQIIDKYVANQTKFIFIIPEYNGSFPGVLKVFLDAISPKLWEDNKACLTGISTGRAGNLRGLEHLTNILNYLKINVYHFKQPLSIVDKLLDSSGNLIDDTTKKIIDSQIDGFLKF